MLAPHHKPGKRSPLRRRHVAFQQQRIIRPNLGQVRGEDDRDTGVEKQGHGLHI